MTEQEIKVQIQSMIFENIEEGDAVKAIVKWVADKFHGYQNVISLRNSQIESMKIEIEKLKQIVKDAQNII